MTLYGRIVAELQDRITEGRYPPGDLMPSEADLVAEFAVSRGTVLRALEILQERGWITREQGRGTYAASRPGTAAFQRKVEDLERRMDELEQEMRSVRAELAEIQQRRR